MGAKLSIIVPCYNQAQFLDEALNSVMNQKFPDWECIIINDGSTDNTAIIASEWISKDNRYKYIEQENKGVCNARNTAILAAKGEFILPLDADDKISPDYLDLAIKAFNSRPSLKLVYCNAEKFGEEGGDWNLPPFSVRNLAKENIIFSSAVYKKKDWVKIGGYDEAMVDGLEDWEFWIALIKGGGEVMKLEHTGFFYRIKNISRNKSINHKKFERLYDYISIKHADFFVQELGSFFHLQKQIEKTKILNSQKLKSKKFVINLFCETFFGFSIFKKSI